MGGGVVGEGDAIDAGGDELTVADDDGAEGTAALGDVEGGEVDGLLHEGGVGVHGDRASLELRRERCYELALPCRGRMG